MAAVFDPREIYRQVFGYVALPFPAALDGLTRIGASPEGVVKAVKGTFNVKSMLGAEFTSPTKMRIVGATEWYQLPNEPSITLDNSKEIVTTSVNRGNRKGTVKEEFNLSDYSIRIRGIAINEDSYEDYPETDIREIRAIYEAASAIEISNSVLSLFNINRVVFTRMSLPEMIGVPHAQAYELQAISDEDFELELIEE